MLSAKVGNQEGEGVLTAKQKPLVLVIASLLATTAAIAQQADPSPALLAVTPAPPAAEGPSPALPSTPPQPKKDQEAAANEVLNKSPSAASNCYSGFHTSFDYDITGSALTALGRS